jgi:hypothetical protein
MEVAMKQDRFLMGILIGIVALVLIALTIFFARQSKQSYVPEGTPEAVVHNYVLAVLNKDYEKAYGYLADLENKPSYQEFRQSFATGALNPSNAGVKIGRADITGEDAAVEMSMVYTPGDPFSTGDNNVGSAQLVLQDGAWKISYMPVYILWNFAWYQTPPK